MSGAWHVVSLVLQLAVVATLVLVLLLQPMRFELLLMQLSLPELNLVEQVPAVL